MKKRVRVEIDLKALVRNYRRVVRHAAPAGVLAVLKANAYGLGVAPYARALAAAGCRRFGVAEPCEAIELKELFSLEGIDASVQILSSVLPDEITQMVASGVTLPVTDLDTARLIDRAAAKSRVKAKVHVKIDTGMGRLGIPESEAPGVVAKVALLKHLELEGIFSHCPMAYEAKHPFTAEQISRFAALVDKLAAKGYSFDKIHIAASDALNNFPQAAKAPFNLVRTGINLHGSFDPAGRKALKVEPVLTLTTRVAQVRDLAAGTTLGYGRTWCLSGRSKIATISAGYADGLPLALGNRGSVFIGGVRCPIVGRVSMDYTTVDVSHLAGVKPGDEVVCLGRCGGDSITPDDWAAIKGTHAYDIICSLGSRVERVVKGVCS
jgi:alanine racemase